MVVGGIHKRPAGSSGAANRFAARGFRRRPAIAMSARVKFGVRDRDFCHSSFSEFFNKIDPTPTFQGGGFLDQRYSACFHQAERH